MRVCACGRVDVRVVRGRRSPGEAGAFGGGLVHPGILSLSGKRGALVCVWVEERD